MRNGRVTIKWFPVASNPKRLIDDVAAQALLRLWTEPEVESFLLALSQRVFHECYEALVRESVEVERQAGFEPEPEERPAIDPALLVVEPR